MGTSTGDGSNILNFITRYFSSPCSEEIKHIAELNLRIDLLEGEIDIISNAYDMCRDESNKLLNDLNQAALEIVTLEKRLEQSSEVIAHSLQIPKLGSYVGNFTEYDAWSDNDLPSEVKMISDERYYTYGITSWVMILRQVSKSIKKAQLKWEQENLDCDNFARIAWELLNLAMSKSGMKYSGCFGTARSREHMFNIYRTNTGSWFIWEPQTGLPVGLLGQVDDPRYDVFEVRI